LLLIYQSFSKTIYLAGFFVSEHILIMIRAIIELLIPDEPGDVRVNESRRKYRSEAPEVYMPVDMYIEEHPDEEKLVHQMLNEQQV